MPKILTIVKTVCTIQSKLLISIFTAAFTLKTKTINQPQKLMSFKKNLLITLNTPKIEHMGALNSNVLSCQDNIPKSSITWLLNHRQRSFLG